MPANFKDIVEATMQLNLEERAHLAGKLLLSLEKPTESEVERLWLDEAERRLKELHQGKTDGSPAQEVFQRALADLRP